MSRTAVLFLFSSLAAAALSFPATFDGVNVDALLEKPEVVDSYINCLLETSTCNESGQRLKAITPNALLEKCSKCAPYQKDSVVKISKAISTKKPAEWAKILDKYDPMKEHRSDIDQLLKASLEKSADPKAEAKPEESAKPAEAKPEDPAKPAEAAKPEIAAKLAESPKQEKPAELAKPDEAAKPAEPAKPDDESKIEPAKKAKTAEAAKPAELLKPEEPAKLAEIPKPEEPAKPADSPTKPSS